MSDPRDQGGTAGYPLFEAGHAAAHVDQDPTLPPSPVEEFDASIGPETFRLPKLRIRQPITPGADRVPVGSFFATDDPSCHSLGRDLVVLEAYREQPDGLGPLLLLLDLVTGRACHYRAAGRARKPVAEFLTALHVQCARHQRPTWAFSVFALTRRVVGRDGQERHVPVFGPPFGCEPSQVDVHAAIRRRLLEGE